MKVVIGQNLSHLSYTSNFHSSIVADQIMNISSFLSFLETQLGLLLPEQPSFLRVHNWMESVESAKKGTFYERSYKVDPIGVSKNLLSLRDELVSSGWDGSPIDKFKKITDISKINNKFSNISGLPERIDAIIEKLPSANNKIIAELDFSNDSIFLQKKWQDLFKALESNGTKIKQIKYKYVKNSSGDLQTIKESFYSINKKLPQADGSVEIVHTVTPREGAELLARYLTTKDKIENIVILASSKYRPTLANAFKKFDIPFSGNSSCKSLARPSVQILLVTLGLAWYPKDPNTALALLQMPFNPFPKWVAGKLSRALSDLPAVGSSSWKKAITGIVKYLEEQGTEQKDIDKQISNIDKWFGQISTGSDEETDKNHLTAICDVVGEWARKRSADHPSLLQTARMCRDLKDFLQVWPAQLINREILRKIIRETLGQGTAYSESTPQGLGPIIVDDPSEIMSSAGEIIWWDATVSNTSKNHRSYWTLKERTVLEQAGVNIINPKVSSELLAKKWENPIGFAKNKVMFFTFDKEENGNKDYFHPVFNQIFNPEEIDAWLSSLSIRPGEYTNRATLKFMKLIETKYSSDKPEYSLSTDNDWKISKTSVPLRKGESPSSLEVLLGCTLSYALKYHSSLRSTYIPTIGNLYKLIGTLNHKVLELVFKAGKPPSEAEAKKQVSLHLKELIPEMLPELHLPKNTLILKDVEAKLENAAITYSKFLNDNGLEVNEAEADQSKELIPGIKLYGQVDQVLEKDGKVVSVIDFKIKLWGFFTKKLKAGTAIQPAIYSWFYKTNIWPDMGYFGIDKSKIIVAGKYNQSADLIDDAVPPNEVIENLKGYIKESQTNLKKGNLEASGLLDEEDQGDFEPPCRFCDFDGICGKRWV